MRLFLAALAVTALVGCSTVSKQVADEATDTTVMIDAALAKARSGNAKNDGTVRILDDQMFVPGAAMQLTPEKTLPGACNIRYAPKGGATFAEFAREVTSICNIPVRITADAYTAIRGGQQQGQQMQAGTAAPPAAGGLPDGIPVPPGVALPAPISGAVNGAAYSTPINDRIYIDYKGDLHGLFDAVTSRFGLSWRYRSGAVTLYYLDTRFYKLFTIPSTTRTESVTTTGSNISSGAQQSGSSGGGGGGGGAQSGGSAVSTASTTTRIDTDAPKDIEVTIKTMLTPGVGRMTYSPSTGTLVVTDTPENLESIESYVSQENKFRTTSVMLNIELVSMTVSNSSQIGINWNAIYQNLAKNYGIGVASSFATATDAISGSINILEGNSRFSGSELIVNALAKQGNIISRRNPSTSTLNMKPVAVQLANQEFYVDQVTSNQTADVGTSTSASQSSVTAGFNLNMIPYVLPDNETILLQLSMNISDLLAIQSKEIGDITLESPRLNYQVLSQEVRIRSGETLVLAGLESVSMTSDKSGAGSPRFWLFGGGSSTSKRREVLVALITPIVR
ncbi:PilN family type IVB pilus formation outer membrane protein [Xanthomonas euvesicatoria]|uniref:PilN family type IVB pilus formation outer membrane protein n=1 Tax=Xanthomonas euvesicatoria TaxID=456327 RepID=UPI001C45BC98|nr:PilN family type IVB pilus formation outer membrane protein [Xanthomonas euvesicatoria]MBV6867859.1 PilN family type IVB pilus formation outer membrane protein [Xanthomonas campestris pv. coriandri]MCE4330779.1 PilN family type IVB pilus formation outer membrane protein [Xanthomonas campestris pv. coriandri]